ncbi:MAG: hypothetical protein M3160_07450 [Candidatus Eremiobacteraeota bacterium]|nr:hypothetical protein [Candidatus Eremiobacteraeota bacterium]
MRRAFLPLALALVVLPIIAFAGSRVTLPGGTPMKVRMVDSISSASATVGESFAFKADQEVVVNGWVVIAKDAPGQGEVVSVQRAGGHGHSGNLGVKFNYIYGVDGMKIRLSTNAKHEGENRSGASSTATVASTILLGPIGLFAHNMVRGHEVVLDGSRTLDAFVDGTVHIAAKDHSLQDPNSGYAH